MIKTKDIIEIDLILKDANTNEILDTTKKEIAKENNLNLKNEYKPLNYVFGTGELLKGIEDNISDLEVSKTKTFILKKEQAFKDKDPKKIELVSLNEFKKENVRPEVGLFVNIGNRSGKIISVSGGRVKVDFNPIYAGRDLEYTVTINKVISKDSDKLPLLLEKAFYFMPKEQINLISKENDIEVEMPLGVPQEIDYFKQFFAKLVFDSTNYENVKFVQKLTKKKGWIILNDKTLKTGTTTVGIVAKDGIVLAADMQATMGNLAVNNNTTKIYKINDSIAMTIAGSVGDAMVLIRYLQNHANLYELEHKRPLSTKSCVTLLSNILNSSKMLPFYSQLIVAGADQELYSLDMLGGFSKEDNFSFSGSGSELALSALDKGYKNNISIKDTIELAKDAITSAKKRDVYTGGDGIKVVIIKKDGIEELPIEKYK